MVFNLQVWRKRDCFITLLNLLLILSLHFSLFCETVLASAGESHLQEGKQGASQRQDL